MNKHLRLLEELCRRGAIVWLIVLALFNLNLVFDGADRRLFIKLPDNLILKYDSKTYDVLELSSTAQCRKNMEIGKEARHRWEFSQYPPIYMVAHNVQFCVFPINDLSSFEARGLRAFRYGDTEKMAPFFESWMTQYDKDLIAEAYSFDRIKPRTVWERKEVYANEAWWTFTEISFLDGIISKKPLFLPWLILLIAIRFSYLSIKKAATRIYK